MFGILWTIVLIAVFVYTALGINFAVRAGITEKAVGRDPKPGDLLTIGVLWLPLFITDPQDFTSVEVIRIRAERREQKALERRVNVAKAESQTLKKRVVVEKTRMELEALRTKAEQEIDRHRQVAEEFINLRHTREISAGQSEVEEAEIVPDHSDPKLPLRYRLSKEINGEEYVYDQHDQDWIPKWAMITGYRYEQY